MSFKTGPRSAVGNVSDCRYKSDCRSRGRKFDPGPVPYFFAEIAHEIISTTILLPPLIQEVLFVSYKRKYVHKVLVNG